MGFQCCLDYSAPMHNETMFSRQTCILCCRVFCFFFNCDQNVARMFEYQNTCDKECIYETMATFRLLPFHGNADMKIPSESTCPRYFNLEAYAGKCKCHTRTVCKHEFCSSKRRASARENTGPDTTMSAAESPSARITASPHTSSPSSLGVVSVMPRKKFNGRRTHWSSATSQYIFLSAQVKK